jgi:hypothetical protein
MAALWVQAWATVALVVAAIAAAFYAGRQIRTRKIDRVLELHNQFASGLVGASRRRFSNLMWKAGRRAYEEERAADPAGRWLCWKPSWESIFPQDESIFPQDAARRDDFNKRRFLGEYPKDIPGWESSNPVADLRQVLWCIGRIYGARERKEVNDALLINLLGWEVVWWHELCQRLRVDTKNGGGVTGPLDELARWILKKQGSKKLNYMNGRGYEPGEDFPSEAPEASEAYFRAKERKLYDNWKEDVALDPMARRRKWRWCGPLGLRPPDSHGKGQ